MDEFWIVHLSNNDESEFETWKIILIVFGVVFLLSILGFSYYIIRKRK